VVQTSSLRGYLMLSFVAGLRRWRRGTLRFAEENARIEAWLADIRQAAASDPALACEVARCQGLVKGYGDTHERGLRNYASLRSAWQRGGARVTAALLAEWRQAALADEQGKALAAALAQHALA
jgi:indolepyruvate ferredoxin oxidoreductase beta subunit